MRTADPVLDPTDIAHVNATAAGWATGGETVKPVAIQRVVVEPDALDILAELARRVVPSGRLLLVADSTPMRRKGEDLKALVAEALARRGPCASLVLPPEPAQALHATWEAADDLAGRLAAYAGMVVVGSGSITDVAKYARHRHAEQQGRSIPLLSFPTAASVTAYTSALAVLKVDGVKRTLPAAPPDMVVCDLQTLADAPAAMTAAGFGDVLARSVSYGDWYLSWQLGMDDGFSEVPGRMLRRAEQDMIDAAEAVAKGTLDGVRTVNHALLLAGMAMSVVNQTAPVSGWEHVISHYLDMTADHDGREQALHGAQVGAATLISALAYEAAWDRLEPAQLAEPLLDGAIAEERAGIERTFAAFDPSGKMGAEVWRGYEKKARRWQGLLDTRRQFVARKQAGEFDDYLRANVRPAAEVARALEKAGAPRQLTRVDRPISEGRARAAIAQAHLVRARFTFGDLLARGGWLTAQTIQELLDAAGQER